MKTEEDLPTPTATEAAAEEPAGLFTDHIGDGGGESMLPGYDGAEPSATVAPETVDGNKTGDKLLRLKLPSGHTYTAKTERELLEQVYKGKIAADQAILDREAQIRSMQAAPAAPPAPLAITQSAPTIAPGEAWDPQRYLNLLGEDPMKARLYQDKFMYGGLDPVQATSYAYGVAQRMEQQNLAMSFHDRNPDFPISPENSAKLMGVLQARSLAPNIVNLEWAFGELKRSGTLVPAGPGSSDENEYEEVSFGAPAPTNAPPATPRPAAPAPQMQAGPQRRGGGAPPSPRNGGGNNSPDVINFEDMSLEQLKEHGRKIGAYKH